MGTDRQTGRRIDRRIDAGGDNNHSGKEAEEKRMCEIEPKTQIPLK